MLVKQCYLCLSVYKYQFGARNKNGRHKCQNKNFGCNNMAMGRRYFNHSADKNIDDEYFRVLSCQVLLLTAVKYLYDCPERHVTNINMGDLSISNFTPVKRMRDAINACFTLIGPNLTSYAPFWLCFSHKKISNIHLLLVSSHRYSGSTQKFLSHD